MQITAFRVSLLSMCCAAILVTACGGEKKAATQVAAKVNKEEISVHQINGALSRAGNLSPEQAKVAGREVLEKLVDQELLVEKAMDKKLDREPRVMQALEASRRQILAQAYMEQLVAAVAKPSGDEVKAYFDKHPELFAERRIYRFQEINVAAGRDQLPALQQRMTSAKTLNDVLAWLKEKNIQFAGSLSTKAAEQLPMELLPKFGQMKDGQTAVIQGDKGSLLIQLVESKSAPVDLAAATPIIEQYLTNQRRGEMAAKEVKQLRADAKIEYMGDFAKDADTLAAETKAAADAKAKATADAQAKAEADAAAKALASAAADADAKARAELKAKVDAQAKAEADKDAAKAAGNKPAGALVAKESISKGLSGLR
jgi:EpsD family peptidyl-prolyl cis-trans isomerase